jgi:chloramphenicol 3-O phosphotransferase
MTARIVLLNGAGSAGKSAIAKALQALTAEPFLHLGLDTFIEMTPQNTFGRSDGLVFETTEADGKPLTIVKWGAFFDQVMRGMVHAIAALAEQGNNLIVDDVMLEDRTADYVKLLSKFRLYRVGVFAPLDVLERRERERGDRALGLARWQFDRVHQGVTYDLELDTSKHTPAACAEQIVRAFGL